MHRASVPSVLAVLALSAPSHAQPETRPSPAAAADTTPPASAGPPPGADLVPFFVESNRPRQILTIAPDRGRYLDVCALPCMLYLRPGPFTFETRERGRARWSARVVVSPYGGSASLYPPNHTMLGTGAVLVPAGVAGIVGSLLLFASSVNLWGTTDSTREDLGVAGFFASVGLVVSGLVLIACGTGGTNVQIGAPRFTAPPASPAPSPPAAPPAAPPRREPTEPSPRATFGFAPDPRGGGSLVAALRF